MHCPKVLWPIFAFHETYTTPTTVDIPLNSAILQSSFHSVTERLTPECKYTRFDGPTASSSQAVILLNGEEVIQASLQDYIYRIHYNTTSAAKFWRVSTSAGIATQVFDTRGNLAENLTGMGSLDVYGFYFPLVVELPIDGTIALIIQAIHHFTAETNPIFAGNHCVQYKNCKKELAYTVVFNPNTGRSTRIVAPKFQECSSQVREKYLSVISLPCRDNAQPSSNLQSQMDIATVDSDTFINNYLRTVRIHPNNPCFVSVYLPFLNTGFRHVLLHNTIHPETNTIESDFQPVTTIVPVSYIIAWDITVIFNDTGRSCVGPAILQLQNLVTKEVLAFTSATLENNAYHFRLDIRIVTIPSDNNVCFSILGMVEELENNVLSAPTSISGTVTFFIPS